MPKLTEVAQAGQTIDQPEISLDLLQKSRDLATKRLEFNQKKMQNEIALDRASFQMQLAHFSKPKAIRKKMEPFLKRRLQIMGKDFTPELFSTVQEDDQLSQNYANLLRQTLGMSDVEFGPLAKEIQQNAQLDPLGSIERLTLQASEQGGSAAISNPTKLTLELKDAVGKTIKGQQDNVQRMHDMVNGVARLMLEAVEGTPTGSADFPIMKSLFGVFDTLRITDRELQLGPEAQNLFRKGVTIYKKLLAGKQLTAGARRDILVTLKEIGDVVAQRVGPQVASILQLAKKNPQVSPAIIVPPGSLEAQTLRGTLLRDSIRAEIEAREFKGDLESDKPFRIQLSPRKPIQGFNPSDFPGIFGQTTVSPQQTFQSGQAPNISQKQQKTQQVQLEPADIQILKDIEGDPGEIRKFLTKMPKVIDKHKKNNRPGAAARGEEMVKRANEMLKNLPEPKKKK